MHFFQKQKWHELKVTFEVKKMGFIPGNVLDTKFTVLKNLGGWKGYISINEDNSLEFKTNGDVFYDLSNPVQYPIP